MLSGLLRALLSSLLGIARLLCAGFGFGSGSLGLCTLRGLLLCLHLRLLGGKLRLLGGLFGIHACLLLGGVIFGFYLANGDDASVLGCLHRFTCVGDGLFAITLFAVCIVRILEGSFGGGHGVCGVLFCACGVGDLNRIHSLVEFQGRALITGDGMQHGVAAGSFLIGPARKQRVMGIHLLDDTFRLIVDHEILHDDHVTGHGDCVVRLGRNNQTEGLEVGGHGDLVLVFGAGGKYLAEVNGPAFRGNSPQDVGQILHTEAISRRQTLEFSVDHGPAALALNFGGAFGGGEKTRALETDFCGAAAIEVVDRGDITPDYLQPIERSVVVGPDRPRRRAVRPRLRGRGIRFLGSGHALKSEPGCGEQEDEEMRLAEALDHVGWFPPNPIYACEVFSFVRADCTDASTQTYR